MLYSKTSNSLNPTILHTLHILASLTLMPNRSIGHEIVTIAMLPRGGRSSSDKESPTLIMFKNGFRLYIKGYCD